MNWTIMPSEENVEKLQSFKEAPFNLLLKYEKNLMENEFSKRALVMVGKKDLKEFVEERENLTLDNWFIVKENVDVSTAPENYFNIIVWSDCDIKNVVKQVAVAFQKLTRCGSIYILNFMKKLNELLENCLSNDEISTITIQLVLEQLLKVPYSINGEHIIIVKGSSQSLLPTNEEAIPTVAMTAFKHSKNSCFMDSIVFPLLAIPNTFLEKKLAPAECSTQVEEIKTIIRDEIDIIRNARNLSLKCKPFINWISNYKSGLQHFITGEQQDDSEFLRALMDLINLTPTKINRKRYTSDNQKDWVESSSFTELTNIIEFYFSEDYTNSIDILNWLQSERINNYQNVDIKEWPKDAKNEPHQFSKEVDTILEAEAIIIHVNRKIGDEKIDEAVTFPEYIQGPNDTIYHLAIVTIHTGSAIGGHYTCYFKSDDWFEYDDLRSDNRVRPATWDMVREEGSVNCSLLVYVM